MTNRAPVPQLEDPAAAQIAAAHYQRGYDDPATALAVEARLDEVGAPVGDFAPVQPSHLTEAGMRGEQSSRWGNLWNSYRYQGVHRARRDQPSSQDHGALTPGDMALKEVLHEVREQAYTEALAQAAADGASEKAAEVRARSAAQAAVSEYYHDVQNYRVGKHTATGQARSSGAHARPTLRGKVVDWFTYSPEEVSVRDQQKVEAYERKHPQARLRGGNSDVFIPDNVYTRSGPAKQAKPSRAERRYQQAVGAVDYTASFDQGKAAVAPEARALAPLTPDTPEGVMIDLVESGARTREEVFNQLYGARTVGGSAIYGGKILSENPGLLRKITEAGTTNMDNVGPVEHATADEYAEGIRHVAYLEAQVTDRFVPSQEIVEGMLFGNTVDPETLSEDQRLLVQVVYQRLLDIHSQKRQEQVPDSDIERQRLHPGLAPDKTDYLRSLRTTWRNTSEAMKGLKAKTERAVGIVALHGAVWAASASTAVGNLVSPGRVPEQRGRGHNHRAANQGSEAWRDGLDPNRPTMDAIRIYSPDEVVRLASSWAFVRAQMVAMGTLRTARDWFRPRDYETGERSVSLLRLAGAAASLAVAATMSYGYYKANGGEVSLDTIQADLASMTQSQ